MQLLRVERVFEPGKRIAPTRIVGSAREFLAIDRMM